MEAAEQWARERGFVELPSDALLTNHPSHAAHAALGFQLVEKIVVFRKDLAQMKPRISVVTLGVDDLERSVLFYRDGLGFPTEGIVGREFDHGAVAFFELEGGSVKLALWQRGDLAHDSGLPVSRASTPPSFSLGHNVGSRAAVDALITEAERAGATIVKRPQETFWGGYAGYFQDPDGHLWEVVWNPAFVFDA